MNEFDESSWEHWVDRPYGSFIATLSFRGTDPKYHKIVGLNGFGFHAYLYQYPNIYLNKKDIILNLKELRRFLSKKNIFDLTKLLEKFHNESREEIKKIIKSNNNPLEKLSLLREIVCCYYPFIWILYSLEEYYNKLIEEVIPKYIKGDIHKWVGDVSIPKKKNAYALMQNALLKKPIEKVREEFGWLKSRDGFSDFYTVQELEEIKKNISKVALHEFDIPKPLIGLVKELKELTFYRTDRIDKYYEMYGLTRPIFQEVADYINIPFKELAFYDADSILSGKPKKIESPFNYLYFNGKQKIQKNKFVDFSSVEYKEIKGRVAYRGFVRGVAKIVRHPSEVSKVNSGDILVSQMTFPSFISAMQKASAFITDEGSITCHAAIIAREMRKPCVIGTKIATKAIKDGDLIEVDAEKGIVRILDKAKKN